VVNPRLVYASISGYGEDGPYRLRPGFDQIAQGMGGLMSITGLPGQGPVRVGIPIADLCAGIFCAYGIAVAVIEREKSGRGQWVKSSLLQAQLFMLDFQAARWLMSGEVPKQAGNNHPTSIPTGVFRTRDGHMNLANSLALSAAKVTRDTKDVAGGTIVRDAAGEPTGILKDNALRGADDFTNSTVGDEVDPMAQEVTELRELEFGKGGPEIVAIATGHRVDHPAKESFIGRELHDGARELRQIGNRRLLLGRAAEFDAAQNTQLDPYPLAHQFAIGEHLDPFQHPAERV